MEERNENRIQPGVFNIRQFQRRVMLERLFKVAVILGIVGIIIVASVICCAE